MNLFIAIILEGFASSSLESSYHLSSSNFDNFQSIWKIFDPKATKFIHVSVLPDLLDKLNPPLGWKNKNLTEKKKKIFISQLDIPVYSVARINLSLYSFYDILIALSYDSLTNFFNLKEFYFYIFLLLNLLK